MVTKMSKESSNKNSIDKINQKNLNAAEERYKSNPTDDNLRDVLFQNDLMTERAAPELELDKYKETKNGYIKFLNNLDPKPSTIDIKKFMSQVRFIDGDLGIGFDSLKDPEIINILEVGLEGTLPLNKENASSRKLVEQYINSQIQNASEHIKFPKLNEFILTNAKLNPEQKQKQQEYRTRGQKTGSLTQPPKDAEDLSKSRESVAEKPKEAKPKATHAPSSDKQQPKGTPKYDYRLEEKDGGKVMRVGGGNNSRIIRDNNGNPIDKAAAKELMSELHQIQENFGQKNRLKLREHYSKGEDGKSMDGKHGREKKVDGYSLRTETAAEEKKRPDKDKGGNGHSR
jgi:hypothetical protein